MVALSLSFILIFLLWFITTIVLRLPQLFSIFLGSLILREVAIHLRHIRNITLFRLVKSAGGLTGKVEYSRWLSLKMSAAELLSFAGLFLFISLALGSWLFLGGAISCFVTGFQHWGWSKKFHLTVKEGEKQVTWDGHPE
jgi:hypothetical protein